MNTFEKNFKNKEDDDKDNNDLELREEHHSQLNKFDEALDEEDNKDKLENPENN